MLLYACCNLPELWYLMVSTYSAEFRGGLDEGHANDKQITTDSITCESMHQHRGVGLSLPLSMHAEWCGLGEAMAARQKVSAMTQVLSSDLLGLSRCTAC